MIFGFVLRQAWILLMHYLKPTLQDQRDQAQHALNALELRKKHLEQVVTQHEHALVVCAQELADIQTLVERWHKRLQESHAGYVTIVTQRLHAYATHKKEQLRRYNIRTLESRALQQVTDNVREIMQNQYADERKRYTSYIIKACSDKGLI
jgi:hypothetical protein